MTHLPCQKRSSNPFIDHDLISNLPREIKETILTKLPIKEAARTSILSTKWMYTWTSIPHIVLRDYELVPDVDGPGAISHLVRIIDVILSVHKGPILNFSLLTKHLCIEAFDRWILNLSRNGITQVNLLLKLSNMKYMIPLSFFFCNALQNVDLYNCSIELPFGFQGFKLLKTLKLNRCSIPALDIEKLISSSPKLVELSLMGINIMGNLHIHAKNLKRLGISGTVLDLQIDAPQLTVVGINITSDSSVKPFLVRPQPRNNLSQTLGGLLNIGRLVILAISIQYILGENVMKLSRAFSSLKHLAIVADLEDLNQSIFLFSLVQSVVNLKKLGLVVRTTGIDNGSTSSSFWEKRAILGSALDHLREVYILRFNASEPVLAFVKFILCSAPGLKKLIICGRERSFEEENPMVFERVLEFPRASAEAEVLFKFNDV